MRQVFGTDSAPFLYPKALLRGTEVIERGGNKEVPESV